MSPQATASPVKALFQNTSRQVTPPKPTPAAEPKPVPKASVKESKKFIAFLERSNRGRIVVMKFVAFSPDDDKLMARDELDAAEYRKMSSKAFLRWFADSIVESVPPYEAKSMRDAQLQAAKLLASAHTAFRASKKDAAK